MDIHLIQAVRQTRRLAADHDGAAWERLRAALDEVLATLVDESDDVGYSESDAGDRLTRPDIDRAEQDRLRAALMALGDDPSDDHAEQAAALLESASGRLDG